MKDEIWVFSGARSFHSGGVFIDRKTAEEWIQRNQLTGTLTLYPLNIGVYEWAIGRGYFEPRTDKEKSSEFIGKFTCAQMEHYHYEDGVLD